MTLQLASVGAHIWMQSSNCGRHNILGRLVVGCSSVIVPQHESLVFFQNISSEFIFYLYSATNSFIETKRKGILLFTTENPAHDTCHLLVYHVNLICYSFIILTNIIGNHITKIVKAISLIYIWVSSCVKGQCFFQKKGIVFILLSQLYSEIY